MKIHQHTSNPLSPSVYPFTAIVGQEEMKLALILNVIDPLIGGVLIMGHRGTGKSTAVRALANLLPGIWTVSGCSYNCDPADPCNDCLRRRGLGEKLKRIRTTVRIVDLPLGATEDRICGTIDIEAALKEGFKLFEPGLLARANRGFLYIDEVNLLEDHLVDLLLDVAATGRNKVERESISIEHPARFVLVGSGNPEEGELRPQLIDRFGLHVEVKTEDSPDRRMEIVELRQAFEKDAVSFCESVAEDQSSLRKKIISAQRRVGEVKIDRALLRQIAELCTELRVDGHRGELTIVRAACALAAFDGRRKVTAEDVRRVAVMSLRHRLRRDPLDEISGGQKIEQALDKVFEESRASDGRGGSGNRGDANGLTGSRDGDSNGEVSIPSDESNPFVFETRRVPEARSSPSTVTRNGRQNARRTRLNYERGRYTAAVNVKRSEARVAIDATLRALAGDGSGVRYRVPGVGRNSLPTPDTRHLTPASRHLTPALPAPDTRHLTPALPAPDTRHLAPILRHLTPALRYKQLARKTGATFILAIDASGSMARNRIAQAKGAALHLLRESYIKRDRVAIVGFRGTNAEVLLPPSKSMLRASRVLDSLPVGGGTPLSAALSCSLKLARRVKADGSEIYLLLFTDGQANVSTRFNGNGSRAQRQAAIQKEVAALGSELKRLGVQITVVDTQPKFIANDAAHDLAKNLAAEYRRLGLNDLV